MKKRFAGNTLTVSQVNQDFAKAQRAVAAGPLIITTRGAPSLVLMTYENYVGRLRRKPNLADRLHIAGLDDVEVDFPPLKGAVKAANLG